MFSTFFYVQKSCFPSLILSQIHTQYRHTLMNTDGDVHRNFSSALPCEFINKIDSQLKSYMTFLSSEVLEVFQP